MANAWRAKKSTFDEQNHFCMTLEQVNLMRKANGQEPLTELPENLGGPKKEETPAASGDAGAAGGNAGDGAGAKTPEQIEAERKAAEGKGDKPAELSDEELLALLNKRGISAAKLEDLKPKVEEPDAAAVAEQREANELAYGLSQGLFKKSDYDSFVADMKDPQTLVFADFYAEAKKEDPTLSDEDIQAEFEAEFSLDAEKDSRKWKRGINRIKELAKNLINTKHSKVLSAKDAFSKHEKSTTDTAAAQKKIQDALPTYRADVEEVFAELTKIPVKFSDTESYEVKALEDSLNALKTHVLTTEYAANKISSGYEKAKMKEEIKAAFLYNNFAVLAQEVSKQVLEKKAAGGRGIELGPVKKDQDNGMGDLTEAQKKLVAYYKEAAGAN